jgi:hypothetical protein
MVARPEPRLVRVENQFAVSKRSRLPTRSA